MLLKILTPQPLAPQSSGSWNGPDLWEELKNQCVLGSRAHFGLGRSEDNVPCPFTQWQSLQPPHDFAEFWQTLYRKARAVDPQVQIVSVEQMNGAFVYRLQWTSTDRLVLGGWLVLPCRLEDAQGLGRIAKAVIVGHGYGGRTEPDWHWSWEGTALFYPCARGLGLSAQGPFASDPQWHVLHHLENKNLYVLGGCAEDLWTSVSALLALLPQVAGRIAYYGCSFAGGVGALALPWEARIQRAALSLPTFGNHPLRMLYPGVGSALAVAKFAAQHPGVLHEVLPYFDAVHGAAWIRQPVLFHTALRDPFVNPLGQLHVAWACGLKVRQEEHPQKVLLSHTLERTPWESTRMDSHELIVSTSGHGALPKNESIESIWIYRAVQRFLADL